MMIRKATREEVQKISRHAYHVVNEATVGFIKPTPELVAELITPFLENDAHYLLYKEDQQVKGWIGVGTSYDYLTHQTVGVILELYVFPTFRKQGIAKKLIEEATKRLKDQGYNKVQLQVYAGNQAKSLYQKLCFEEVVTMMEKDLNK